jgi:excisionase family DNA binding protein
MTTLKKGEHLLSKEEFSVYLNVSVATLDRWQREKRIIPIRIGRTVRYTKDCIVEPSKTADNGE